MGKIHSSLEYRVKGTETEGHTLQEGKRRAEGNVLQSRDILDWVWNIQRDLVLSWASAEESVEGEPGTLRIQVCTRCIIGAGFCSLYQFVSNEIIFADVAMHCRDIIRRQSQTWNTLVIGGRPLIRFCVSNQSKNTTHKGKGRGEMSGTRGLFFFLTPIFHKLLYKRLSRVILAGLLWTQWLGHHWK